MVPNEMSIKVLKSALRGKTGGIFLDGYPRNLGQLTSLNLLGYKINKVIFFNIPEDICLGRLLKRGRFDDQFGIIKQRFKVFTTDTFPIIKILAQSGVIIEEITMYR